MENESKEKIKKDTEKIDVEKEEEEEKEKTEEEKAKEEEERLKYEEKRRKMIEEENEKEKKNFDKYRINFLSFKTSLPNTKIKSLCPMCSEIPDISLSLNGKSHYVKCASCRYCYCCSRPRSTTLDDYICIMVKIQQENIKCDIHKEKGIDEEGYFSCEYCQKWMCEECINKHIKEKDNEQHTFYIIRKASEKNLHTHCPRHNLKAYSYYVTEDFMLGYHICEFCDVDEDDMDTDIKRIPIEKGACFLKQLKEILKNGVEYLDVYCQNIYNQLIKSINNDPELLKKAKEIYDNFLIRNRRVLFYYQMVINSATPSFTNYNLIRNIESLLLTKFEKIKIPSSNSLSKEEIDKILNFFEQNYIVGKDEKKLEDIKEFNIKELSKFKKEENLSKEAKDKKSDKDNSKEEEKNNKNKDKKNKITYINMMI